MYDLATLWLVAAIQKGMWIHCAYASDPPTVMQPEPPVHVVYLYQPEQLPDEGCPVKIMESTTVLPPDAA